VAGLPAEAGMNLLATGSRILASRLGQVLFNAGIGLFLARMLAPAGLGHYSLTVAIVMFMAAVLNGGVGLAAVPPLRRGLISLRRMLRAQIAWILAAGMLLLLSGLILSGLGLTSLAQARLGWSLATAMAAGLAVWALLSFDVFFYDLLAEGKLATGPFVNLLRAALHAILLGIVWFVGELHLTGAVTAFGAAQLCAALTVAVILWRRGLRGGLAGVSARAAADPTYWPPPPQGAGAPPAAIPRLIGWAIRRGWTGQLSAVASLLHLRLDLALVSAFCGAATVGIYSAAVIVGELLWHLPAAMSLILVHASAAGERPAQRDENAARAVRIGLAVTLLAAIPLACLAGPLLRFAFGPEYAASAPPLRALLPGIVAFAPGAILAGDFIGRGKPVWNAAASIVTVVANVLAGLWLIPRHGAVGASWASSLAYTVGAAMMVLRFHQATRLPFSAILLPRRSDFR
jgi:O-antigen/teichoic acid export membrane protein